jgi:predicted RNase H-like nuclease (RuvC/YqgF family)
MAKGALTGFAWTHAHNLDQAEAHVEQLTQLIQQLPGARLDINLDALRRTIARCREQYESQQSIKREIETRERELAQLNSHLN